MKWNNIKIYSLFSLVFKIYKQYEEKTVLVIVSRRTCVQTNLYGQVDRRTDNVFFKGLTAFSCGRSLRRKIQLVQFNHLLSVNTVKTTKKGFAFGIFFILPSLMSYNGNMVDIEKRSYSGFAPSGQISSLTQC